MSLREELLPLIRRCNPGHRDIDRQIRLVSEHIKRYANNTYLVLDAGCGAGRRSRLSVYFRGVVGADLSRSELEENPNIDHKVVASLEKSPFRHESFGLIICEWVLEHLEDPFRVLSEFYRKLKPGGYIVLTTSNLLNPLVLIGRLLPFDVNLKLHMVLYRVDRREIFPLRHKLNTISKITKQLKAMGFKKVLPLTANYPWYFKFNKFLFIAYVLFERISGKLFGNFLDIMLIILVRK